MVSQSLEEKTAGKIQSFLRETLGILTEICIDRTHRVPLGAFKPGITRPIIVAFRDFTATQEIISNAYKLKNTTYSTNRDYPPEIVDGRKSLWPQFKKLKQDNPNNKVVMAYPAKIITNGQIVNDAFPKWNTIMQRSRVKFSTQNKQSASNTHTNTPRAARAQVEGSGVANGPIHYGSRSSHASDDSNTNNATPQITPRRKQSRSCLRRAHAPSRQSRASTRSGRSHGNNEMPTPNQPDQRRDGLNFSESNLGIRRPWMNTDANPASEQGQSSSVSGH